MRYRFYRRRFLNQRGFHAGGYVFATVQDTSGRKKPGEWTDVEFTVADCGRQMSLSFDPCPDELANSLYKVDVLIETMTRFRAALVEEGRLEAQREVRAKAKRKKSRR